MKQFLSLPALVVLLFMIQPEDANGQPTTTPPSKGASGLLGLNLDTELFAGFGPFVIFKNGQLGNSYYSMFGFNMDYFNSNGMDWSLFAYYNDPTFITTLLDDVWTGIEAGETWDIGTNLISSISGSFNTGLTYACFNFEQPSIEDGFPGDDPLNPNLTFGGNLDLVLVDGILSFGGDLNILLGSGMDIQEFNIQTSGSIQLADGTAIETFFDINNILQPNQFGLACGAYFVPSISASQTFGNKGQYKLYAGVNNPVKVGKLGHELPMTFHAGIKHKFKL
jgi:hypothetical protein